MSSDYRKAFTALAVTAIAGGLIDYRIDPGHSRMLALEGAWADGEAQADTRARAGQAELRVCADPNNLPFSNDRGQGFENVLAAMVAKDLGRTLHYSWWPQRRGFVRNTLNAGQCEVMMGVPSDYELAVPTAPYYRSSYVFVTRRDRHLHIASLDDPALRRLRIGVDINSPPAHALALRDLQGNIRGYSIYGDYLQPNPPRALIDAVAQGEVDVAVAWGPLAGYFMEREPVALEMTPVPTPPGEPTWPMVYAISMGVRNQDAKLRTALDAELAHRGPQIERLLERYGVPLVEVDGRVRLPREAAE